MKSTNFAMQYHRRFMALLAVVLLLGTALFSTSLWGGAHPVDAVEPSDLGASAASTYGVLPLSFIANAGQADPGVRFQVHSRLGTISLEPDGMVLSLPATVPSIRLTFEDANSTATLDGKDQLPGIANFFVGSDPSRWRTYVPTYAGVVYHDLYPGVELHYSGYGGRLKGTYTLAAGAAPSVIRWRYSGAQTLSLDTASGNLIVGAPDGVKLVEQAPVAWQTRTDGPPTPVMVSYQLAADGLITFVASAYDHSAPLTIDPEFGYSTYLGGADFDRGYGIAVDGGGSAYVTGFTYSANFPATSGAVQPTLPGAYVAFVSKLNPTGSALTYSTYLGSSGGAWAKAYAIAIDSSGDVYVTGSTSGNFPTTPGAFQTTAGTGLSAAFMTKLNATGSALVYSTYLGGSGTSQAYGIAVDGSGNAYVTGATASKDFPTTAGAYQTSLNGHQSAFMSKLMAGANGAAALVYSTYLGGRSVDEGTDVALDASGNVYVCGDTTSANFPTTVGAAQTTFSGSEAAFVSKLDLTASGSAALAASTFLTGSDTVAPHQIVAFDDKVYVVGQTDSSNYPTTVGAYQPAFRGTSEKAFVTILDAALRSLTYSTFLGGNNFDIGYGLAVDARGAAYVTGYTGSTNFPTTTGPSPALPGGGYTGFVTKLDPTLSGIRSLVYSTYLGGSGGAWGQAIAVDSSGNAYVTGSAGDNFPITGGALQTTFGGGTVDAFVSKLTRLIPSTPVPTHTLTHTPTPSHTPTPKPTRTPTNTPAPITRLPPPITLPGTLVIR